MWGAFSSLFTKHETLDGAADAAAQIGSEIMERQDASDSIEAKQVS